MMTVLSDLAHILLLVAVLAWAGRGVFGGLLGSRGGATVGFAVAALVSLLPGPWNPAFHIRGLLGDPGAIGWILLLHLLRGSVQGKGLLDPAEIRALCGIALAGGLLIYPASFGLPGAPDLYEAGFGGFFLPTAALLIAGIFLWRGWGGGAAAIAGGLLLYGLEVHESANLWDCLMDFPTFVAAAVVLVRWALSRRLRGAPDGVSLPV